MCDTGVARSSNMLDQILFKNQILNELHHQPQNVDPSIEQMIQAKYGQLTHQGHPYELLDLIACAKHGQMAPIEHQMLQHEQFHGRQLSHLDQPDIYQHQRLSPEELTYLDHNLSIQERLQQGVYDPNPLSFDRSFHMPGGSLAMNLDLNSVARAHQSFHPPQNNGQVPNEWIESRIQQLHIDNTRQKRDMEMRRISEDPSCWMSARTDDDPNKQSTRTPSDVNNMVAFGSRESNLLNQEVGLNHAFVVGSASQGQLVHESAIGLEGNHRLLTRSSSGSVREGSPFFSDFKENSQVRGMSPMERRGCLGFLLKTTY
ncbi:hypothetical protein Hanom_Chr16g01415401 [Helianthus anomalus]